MNIRQTRLNVGGVFVTPYIYKMSPKTIRKHTPKRPQGIGKKNWNVSEGNSAYEKMKEGQVKLGDTITMITNNQQGYVKYEVIMNEKGKKALRMIDSYDMQMARIDEEYENGTPRTPGGKNRTKKNRTRRYKK